MAEIKKDLKAFFSGIYTDVVLDQVVNYYYDSLQRIPAFYYNKLGMEPNTYNEYLIGIKDGKLEILRIWRGE